jgi:hypothetical protein
MAKAMRLHLMKVAAITFQADFIKKKKRKTPASEGGRYKDQPEGTGRTGVATWMDWVVWITTEKRRLAAALHRLLSEEGGVLGNGFAVGVG